jgi:diaminopimelate epimerase
LDNHSIKIRTYERGVEDETLACGTGTVASALLFALKNNARDKINVYTRSKEVLRVYFKKQGSKFSDVWLEGKARLVFKGEAKL